MEHKQREIWIDVACRGIHFLFLFVRMGPNTQGPWEHRWTSQSFLRL